MAEAASSPKGGKLDNLPKDDLIKYIRKQAVQIRDVKKKNEDLTALLNHEKEEVDRLEQEKKSWLARGVSAEFEKKEKLAKKDRELRIAAQLGQKMLSENDELRFKFDEQELGHQKALKETEAKVAQIMEEKTMLEETVKAVQVEYKLAKEEAQSFSKALEQALADQERESENNKQMIAKLSAEVKELQKELALEREGKGDADLIRKEVKSLKAENEDLLTANLELKARVNSFPNTDAQEMLRMQSELKDMETALNCNRTESEAMKKNFAVMTDEVEEYRKKCAELHRHIELIHADKEECNNYVKQLDEELAKLKSDKEKAVKSIKVLKTKAERGNQLEEELRRQLTTICAERDDIQSKHTTLQREKKTLIQTVKKLKERLKHAQRDQREEEEERGRDSPRGSEHDITLEFQNLKECNQKLELEKKELHDQYEAVKSEISNIEGERSEMEHMIRSYETEVLKLNDKFELLKREHDAIKFENDENHSAKIALEEEKEHLVVSKQVLERDIESIIEEKNGILARYSALEEELNNYKAEPKDGNEARPSGETVTGEEIDLVKSEVMRLEQSLEIVKQQNITSESVVSQLREEVKEKDEVLRRLTDEKQNLEKQCCVLTQRLDGKTKGKECEEESTTTFEERTGEDPSSAADDHGEVTQNLLEELEIVKERCKHLELQLDVIRQREQSVENEAEQLKAEKETLETSYREVLNRMESIEFERAEISTNAQEDLSRLNEEKQDLLETMEREQERRDRLEKLCEDLTWQNDLLSNKQQEHKANVTRLQSRVDELLIKLQALNEEKMHQESEIEELFKAQDELQTKFDVEAREKKDKEFMIKELEERLVVMEKDTSQNNKEKQNTFQRLQDLLKTQENYQGDLQSKINEMRMENESLRQENQALKETTVIYKEEIKSYCAQIEEMKRVSEESSKEEEQEGEKEGTDCEGDQQKELKAPQEQASPCPQLECEVEKSEARDSDEYELLKKERDQFCNSLEEKTALCENLRSHLAELESRYEDFSEMEERLHNLMQLNHEQALQLKQNDCVIQELQEANTELDSMVQTAMRELKHAEDRVQELTTVKEKLAAMESEVNCLAEERQALNERLDSVLTENKEREEEVERLRTALTHSEEAFNDAQTETKESSKPNDAAKEEGTNSVLSQKVSELECVIERLERENSALLAAKNDIETKALSLSSSSDAVETENQTLKETISCLEEEMEKRNSKLVELQEEVTAMSKQIDASKQEMLDLQECNKEVQEELSKKGEDLQKTQKAFAKLKQAFQNQKGKNQNAKESEKKALEEFAEEKQTFLNAMSEKDTLIKELKLMEVNLVQQMEEQIENAAKERESLHQNFLEEEIKLKEALRESESKLIEYEKAMENLNSDMMSDVSRLEETLYEKNLQCQTLTSEKENLDNHCKQLSQDLEETSRTVTLLEEAKSSLEEDIKEKVTLIDTLKTEKEKLLQDIVERDQELESVKSHLVGASGPSPSETTQEILQRAARDAKDKDDYIDELQEEIRHLKAQCEQWKDRIEGAKSERSTLEEKVQRFGSEANAHSEKVVELENALAEKGKHQEAQDVEFKDMQLRVTELEDELQEAFNKLEELEATLKEKEEKVNKFKAVAMRAKKELDNLRSQNDPERERLQSANDQLQKIAQQFEAELLRQREDCQRHEEDYEAVQKEASVTKKNLEEELKKSKEQQKEVESLNDQIERLTMSLASSENETTLLQEKVKEEMLKSEGLQSNLNETTKKFEACSASLQEEQESCKSAKERLKVLEVRLSDAQKESNHMNVMNLEIQDYQKTIESLQKKVADREERIKDCERQISVLDGTIVSLREELATTEKQLQETEEKGNKLKSVLVKTKKELNDSKQTESDLQKTEKSLRQELEATTQLLEDYKLQTTDLLGEKESLLNQLKSNAEMNQRSHQALEMKLSRVQNELVVSQQSNAHLQQEYENYKIRAQTVLKQQKVKTPEDNKSLDKREREMYEHAIAQLKNKVKEGNDHVQVLMHDHEELEVEHERLLQRHSELLSEVQSVDLKWKSRFENAQKDSSERILDYEEKLKELAAQKESITGLYKKQRENYEKSEQEHQNAITSLKHEVDALQRRARRKSDGGEVKESTETKKVVKETKTRSPEKLRLSIDAGSSRLTERQEGEGMDSSLLEVMEPNNSLSPTSPSSTFESANLLERLLSPTTNSPESEWIYSPIQSAEEGIKLKSSHATLEKKVEHLTEVLRESEANSVRLGDQAKILKDEIRRLEKNQEREEAMHNLEYLKNITIKFLKCGPTEREYLVPVLSTMLKLNSEEVDFIKEFAKSEQEVSDANASSWSSYVYRWSSF